MRRIAVGAVIFALGMGFSFAVQDQNAGPPSASAKLPPLEQLADLAPGWTGEVIARVNQKFAGWGVEIGDADNDGKNEILTTGAPDSRLDFFKKKSGQWISRTLATRLAGQTPGLGLVVKVTDLNGDGTNEIVLGTGQEKVTPGGAFFYVFQTDGEKLIKKLVCRAGSDGSGYTHNFGIWDIDGDGVKEVISAYCGSGDIIRYDVNRDLTKIKRRRIFQNSGSGEDSFVADVDNDGKVEYLTADCYRRNLAKVHIFEFDSKGELLLPPSITIEGPGDGKWFDCSLAVGDLDQDGKNELLVMWKSTPEENAGTIVAYRVQEGKATKLWTITKNDKDLDTGYGERLMHIADADNDGRPELVVSTRGESWPANGNRLGLVMMFKPAADGSFKKTILADFKTGIADSCWNAVGDADNDGKNEIIVATGTGDRTKPGISYVVLLRKANRN